MNTNKIFLAIVFLKGWGKKRLFGKNLLDLYNKSFMEYILETKK
jgi:hypothetical protein